LIAQLTGKLIHKQPGLVIVDVAGVGYEVNIPLSTFYELGEVGSDVSLKIHTHVREDVIQLFGFRTAHEKELFLKLTSVSGIGPKLAITILSGIPTSELITAIKTSNLARLIEIPGVGRKTAERVIIELRDRVAALSPQEEEVVTETASANLKEDTIAALVSLGYQKQLAAAAVAAALSDGEQTIEAVLKRALQELSRQSRRTAHLKP
jgi:Holliday junction DNA helicase RuvA